MPSRTLPSSFRTIGRAYTFLHTISTLVVLHPWTTDWLAIISGSFGSKLCSARIPLPPFLQHQGQIRTIQIQRQFSEIFQVPQIAKFQSLTTGQDCGQCGLTFIITNRLLQFPSGIATLNSISLLQSVFICPVPCYYNQIPNNKSFKAVDSSAMHMSVSLTI